MGRISKGVLNKELKIITKTVNNCKNEQPKLINPKKVGGADSAPPYELKLIAP